MSEEALAHWGLLRQKKKKNTNQHTTLSSTCERRCLAVAPKEKKY
jgi:hypothetical protein